MLVARRLREESAVVPTTLWNDGMTASRCRKRSSRATMLVMACAHGNNGPQAHRKPLLDFVDGSNRQRVEEWSNCA